MEDLGYYKVTLKLKRNEEIVDIKSSYSFKEKCHLFVLKTNLNRDLVLEVKEYRR